MGLYAGDISAAAAWELLSAETDATLVDVRTPEEWKDVGVADLSNLKKQPLFLSWRNGGDYSMNENFIPQFTQANIDKEQKVFFMCKGGGRSREAAMAATAMGYKHAYNIANGFEAEHGWKSSNLPYTKAGSKI